MSVTKIKMTLFRPLFRIKIKNGGIIDPYFGTKIKKFGTMPSPTSYSFTKPSMYLRVKKD